MTRPADAQHGVLVLSCQDAPGIVHAVSGLLLDERCTIVESHQFDSLTSGMFYMRVEFAHVDGSPLDFGRLCAAFEPIAARFAMNWRMADAAERQRVLIMVSQYAHCLNDLLFRNSIGELNLDVVAVVSNHPDPEATADFYGVPFHHIPVTRETKPEAEAALLEIVREERVELVVLARYMQILSNELCPRSRAGRSTSTTRCCRASRARGPTTRPTPGASSSSARRRTTSPPTSTRGRSSSRRCSASTTP